MVLGPAVKQQQFTHDFFLHAPLCPSITKQLLAYTAWALGETLRRCGDTGLGELDMALGDRLLDCGRTFVPGEPTAGTRPRATTIASMSAT